MFFVLFFLLHNLLLSASTSNYNIALNKYAQGMSLSNKEREYLDKVGAIVAKAVKHAAAKQSEEKEAESESDDSSIMDPETFNELDFISKKGEGLFYPRDVKLPRVTQAFLAYLSTAQTNDVKVLEKRQSIIRYLQQNPELKAELLAIMGSLEKQAEEAFLNLSQELTEKEKDIRNKFFLSRSFCNFGGILKIISEIGSSSSSAYLQILYYGLLLVQMLIPEKISRPIYNRYAYFCSNHPYLFTLSLTVPPFITFGFARYLSNRFFSSGSQESLIAQALAFSSIVGPSFFCAYKDYKDFFSDREKGLMFPQKIFSTNHMLNQVLAKHPEFVKNLLLKDALKSKVDLTCDPKTAFALNKFKNQGIQKSSFLNYWLVGSRMVVDKILVDNPEIVHKYLFPMLAGLGETHAYSVLADQCKQYCVPQINNGGISIQLNHFFHPNFPDSVPNSLDYLISKDKRFVFVSGPNGSGKSAFARAVLASIVAGHTFGFLPAQKGTLSLFDKIYFAANLSDDLGVASKFQVELAKLKHLHQYLEKNPEKKVLLVMDEPLTTTDSAIAGKVLFNLFTFLKQYPNLAIISISNNSTLKDFKGVKHVGMVVDTNEDGTFKSTYKCKEGHSYSSDVMAQFIKTFGNKFKDFQELCNEEQPHEHCQAT